MARIDDQARTHKKLKNFIQKHRKARPRPVPEREEKPKEKDETIEEEEEEAKQGPFQVTFPYLTGEALENNEKIKTSFFVLDNSPIHFCNDRSRFVTFKQRDPTLPQNKIHCMDIFGTTISIHGVGEVIIQTTTADGIDKGGAIRLCKVKYCPQAPWNAVSIGLLGVCLDEENLMLYLFTKKKERKDFAKVEQRFGRLVLEYNLVE